MKIEFLTNCFCSEGSHESSSVDGNMTQSILQFTPAMAHLGARLRCSASNPLTPQQAELSSDWQLNISCKSADWQTVK